MRKRSDVIRPSLDLSTCVSLFFFHCSEKLLTLANQTVNQHSQPCGRTPCARPPPPQPAASLNPQPPSHNAPPQDLLPQPLPTNLGRIYIPETCPGASRPGHTPSLAISSSPTKTASGQHRPRSCQKPVPLPRSLFTTLIRPHAAGIMTH